MWLAVLELVGCVLLFEEESHKTNVKEASLSLQVGPRQRNVNALAAQSHSHVRTWDSSAQQRARHHGARQKCQFWRSFTARDGGIRSSRFLYNRAVTPFVVHSADASLVRLRHWSALWRRYLPCIKKRNAGRGTNSPAKR